MVSFRCEFRMFFRRDYILISYLCVLYSGWEEAIDHQHVGCYIIDCYYYHTKNIEYKHGAVWGIWSRRWWRSDSSERRRSCGVSRGPLCFWPTTPLKQHGSSAGGSSRQEAAPVNCRTGSHLCLFDRKSPNHQLPLALSSSPSCRKLLK